MDNPSTNNSETKTPEVPAAPTGQEDKSMKKNSKLIALLACGVVLVVMAILLTLYVTVWSKPNKEDFKQAYTAAKSLEDSYNAISDTSKIYTDKIKETPDTASDSEAAKSYDNAVSDHQAKLKIFANQKGLNDEDVKKVYDMFIVQDKKSLAYTQGYIGLKKSLAVCVDVFDVVRNKDSFKAIADAHKKQVQRCSPILKDLQGSSVKVLSDYAKGYDTVITERQKVLDGIVDGSISSESGSDKINELGAKFTIVSTNITKNLPKARDDSSVVKSLTDLEAILQQKASKQD